MEEVCKSSQGRGLLKKWNSLVLNVVGKVPLHFALTYVNLFYYHLLRFYCSFSFSTLQVWMEDDLEASYLLP